MKKRVPFHPLLLGAFPVLAVYVLNAAMVPLQDLWWPLALAVGSAAGLWMVLAALFRSFEKSALLASLTLALFWSYGPISGYLWSPLLQILDALVVGVVVLLLLRTRRDLAGLTRVLNFGACVLMLFQIGQILIKKPPGRQRVYLSASLPVTATEATPAKKPDIFFVILDGYGRADQLQRVMGYSNVPFLDELRSRGFYVADKSHSNYVQTQLSLAATLNLSFLQDYPTVFPTDSIDRDPLRDGMDASFASAYLKRLGYSYIAVTSGFSEVKFDSADAEYKRPLSMTMLETTLLQLTPITQIDPVVSLYEDRRRSLRGALKNLSDLGVPTAKPRFVVVHIIAPHPPFSFDANGGPVRQDVPFGFWDGSHYMAVNGTPQKYRTGYAGQLEFLNRSLLPVIDTLIAKSKAKPVIIIEGDHGSKLGLNQDEQGPTDLRECFGNLMAFYVPDSVEAKLYPRISSVNTFRVLFDGLFNEKLPLLPDRSFYSPFGKPYRFSEVTSKIAD